MDLSIGKTEADRGTRACSGVRHREWCCGRVVPLTLQIGRTWRGTDVIKAAMHYQKLTQGRTRCRPPVQRNRTPARRSILQLKLPYSDHGPYAKLGDSARATDVMGRIALNATGEGV